MKPWQRVIALLWFEKFEYSFFPQGKSSVIGLHFGEVGCTGQ